MTNINGEMIILCGQKEVSNLCLPSGCESHPSIEKNVTASTGPNNYNHNLMYFQKRLPPLSVITEIIANCSSFLTNLMAQGPVIYCYSCCSWDFKNQAIQRLFFKGKEIFNITLI